MKGVTAQPVVPPSTRAEFDAWTKNNLRARAILELAIDSTVMHHVDNTTTAAKAWTALELIFATTNQSSLVHATRQFLNCKMRDSESVEDHVMHFRQLQQKLASARNEGNQIAGLGGTSDVSA